MWEETDRYYFKKFGCFPPLSGHPHPPDDAKNRDSAPHIAVSGLVLPSFQAVPACSKRTFRRAFPASPGSCSLHQACPSIQQSKVTAEGLRHPQTGLAATPLLNTVHSSQAGLCCLPAHGSPPGPPGPPALPIPRFGP